VRSQQQGETLVDGKNVSMSDEESAMQFLPKRKSAAKPARFVIVRNNGKVQRLYEHGGSMKA
jgi:hypothetical protein